MSRDMKKHTSTTTCTNMWTSSTRSRRGDAVANISSTKSSSSSSTVTSASEQKNWLLNTLMLFSLSLCIGFVIVLNVDNTQIASYKNRINELTNEVKDTKSALESLQKQFLESSSSFEQHVGGITVSKHINVSSNMDELLWSYGATHETENDKLLVKRICIATMGFSGGINSGGISTFSTALAQTLVRQGREVTLLYLGGEDVEVGEFTDWVPIYGAQGINLIALPTKGGVPLDASAHGYTSYKLMEWLLPRENYFDAVYFHEWRGYGYYSQLYKHLGLGFSTTLFLVGVHSPTLWSTWYSRQLLDRIDYLEVDFLERTSVELADVVIAPSKYIVSWMLDFGWKLPNFIHVEQNVGLSRDNFLPAVPVPSHSDMYSKLRKVKNIIFFGRLEERKGLKIFIDAIKKLINVGVITAFSIVFLGKEIDWAVGEESSSSFIKRSTESWKNLLSWSIVSDKSSMDALSYIKSLNDPLVVIPSLVENSPYTVHECLNHNIPFIASVAGGTAELIKEKDRTEVLFKPTSDDLATALKKSLKFGVRVIAPLKNSVEIAMSWNRLLEAAPKAVASYRTSLPHTLSSRTPLVTICIVGRNRGSMLRQAVSSALSQDYSPLQIIVADDVSDDMDTLNYLAELESQLSSFGHNSRLVKNSRRMADGGTRNVAAAMAEGELLAFLDDDNILKSNMVSKMVTSMWNSNRDIIASCLDIFESLSPPTEKTEPVSRWAPLGPSIGAGVFRNVFGDTSFIIRRTVFEKVGGFTEEHGLGFTDWEFLAKASLGGYKLAVMPLALYWYRRTNIQRISTSTPFVANQLRALRPYMDKYPELREMLIYSKSMSIKHDRRMGSKKADANSDHDFSNQQGKNGWYYGYFIVSRSNGMTRFSPQNFVKFERFEKNTWMASEHHNLPTYFHHNQYGAHPFESDGHNYWAVRRWKASRAGQVEVILDFERYAYNCGKGDGVAVRVLLDGQQIWMRHISEHDCDAPPTTNLLIHMKASSTLDFAVDPAENNDYFDGVDFSAAIFYKD